MPTPAATPTPTRSPRPKPRRTPSPVESLQGNINAWQADLERHLTRGQRARGMPPRPRAVGTLSTGGLGRSNITPVGGAAEVVGRVLQSGVGQSGLRIANALTGGRVPVVPAAGTEVALKARTHEAGVPGVLRHETAHQLLRSQNVPQRGESVLKKLRGLPYDIPRRDYFRLTEQTGREEKAPTIEQRRRTRQMKQQTYAARKRIRTAAQRLRERANF